MSAWLWSGSARAEPRVELRVVPSGERAERIALRTRELLQGVGVEVDVGVDVAVPREPPLAAVAIDATEDARVWIRIESSDGQSAREVLLEDGLLDEAACEEIATVVSSSVAALLAGEPLPTSTPEAAPVTAPAAAAASPVAQPAYATTPPVAPAREPNAEASATTTDAGPHGELQVRTGYEAALWGEGHVLHGPRLAASYAWPFAWGQLGVGVEGFVAVPGTVESAGVDAELWASAVRLLAVAAFPIGRAFGIETAAGLAAQYTRLEVLSAPAAADVRAASTHWGWAMRLYGGARYRLGRRARGSVALGLALELDPVQVQYGVQYADGFVVTHEPLPARPSLVASGGMVF